MSDLKMSDVNSSEIRKVAQCVYLACDEVVAADIAVKCKRIADAYDSSQELIAKQAERIEGQLKALEVAGKRITEFDIEVEHLSGMLAQRGSDNTSLRGRLESSGKKVKLLQSELGSLIKVCDANTGHEPSLSVYQFTLDFARKALASTKPKPFDNDALINSLIERTGGEV